MQWEVTVLKGNNTVPLGLTRWITLPFAYIRTR